MKEYENYITINEAAKSIGLKHQTLRVYISRKTGPPFRRVMYHGRRRTIIHKDRFRDWVISRGYDVSKL